MARLNPAIATLGLLLWGCPGERPPASIEPTPTALPRTVQGPPTSELTAWLRDPSDRDDPRKAFAATLLGLRGQGVGALTAAVRDERSPRVRAAAVEALGLIGRDEALAPLTVALDDRDPRVRSQALAALSRLGTPAAVEAIAARTGDRGAAVGLAAAGPAGRSALAALDLSDPYVFEPPQTVDAARPGTIHHVDATSGDDAAAGDARAPLRTLAAAVAKLQPGDFLYATSGADSVPFRERVLVPAAVGGSRANPTRILAWPGRPPPVLDGFTADAPERPGPGIGFQVEADHVRIGGWTVRGYDESGIHLGGAWNAAVDCTVERCERHGIFAYYAPRATIVNAVVRSCAAQGISLRSSPFALVTGSRSDNNGIDGLLLLQDSDGAAVVDFSATGNGRGIGLVGRTNDVRIVGADLRGNRGDAVGVDAGCDAIEFDVLRDERP